ncbi:MAG: hypothetical protein CMH62_02935 [Nanoarchaeota archaeon]|nr:hypothetical protein [Nanoarchaeota archaeon]|tara:strand:- start:504 stop:1520 length:1017 start_codon:yes stop_codon:yes gene_type:complete
MITLKQIKNLIEKSENPLIFYDDDPDGLVSYLLLKRHFKKGQGFIVRGKPMLDASYLESVKKYSPDLVIILDKPVVEQEFVDECNVPIIWIDHHPVIKIKGVKYYNPRIKNDKDNRCVSYWCYKLTNEDMWLATIGIVSDYQKPSFIKKFIKEYPELLKEAKDQKEMLFNSNLGKLIKIFGFALKGQTNDVRKNVDTLTRLKNPYDLLHDKNEWLRLLLIKVGKIEKEYDKLLDKAVKENKGKKIVIFIYISGKYSFTGSLSNELMYKFPGKVILVGREKDGDIRMSLRSPEGPKLPKILEKALFGVEGYGGGHDYAVGASVKKEDFDKFIEVIKKEI